MTAAVDTVGIERWFVRRGLPQLIDGYAATTDVFTRMAPFLTLVVFLEFFLVFGDRWEGRAQAVAFFGGIGALVVGVAVVNRIRGRRGFTLPDQVGPWELSIFVVLPVVPAVIGASGGWSRSWWRASASISPSSASATWSPGGE